MSALFRAARAFEALRYALDSQDHDVASIGVSRLSAQLVTVEIVYRRIDECEHDEATALAAELVERVRSMLATARPRMAHHDAVRALIDRLAAAIAEN